MFVGFLGSRAGIGDNKFRCEGCVAVGFWALGV